VLSQHPDWEVVALAHEGFMFGYDGAQFLQTYMASNPSTEAEIFEYDHCMEEFALQTILHNNQLQMYHIGVFTVSFSLPCLLPKGKSVYKTLRGPQKRKATAVIVALVFAVITIVLATWVAKRGRKPRVVRSNPESQ
jgi:cytochrome bd-type quinol oxidase subunit 1